MKKTLSIFLLSVLLFLLAACGNDGSGGTEEADGMGGTEAEGSGESEEDSLDLDVEQAAGEAPQDFSFGSATVGGLWYTLSGAMGEGISELYPNSSVTVVEGGSISNLIGLGEGLYPIGFSNGQTVPEALEGIRDFEEPVENVSTLATLYPNVMHIIVPESSDIESVLDLAGKRVSPGIKGYSGELAFIDILEAVGMDYDDLEHIEYTGTAEAGDLMRDGHIDAFVGMLAAPVPTVQELDTTLGVRLIPLEEDVVEGLNELNPGYLEHTIEGGTYSGIEEDVLTTAGYTVLLANNELIDEDVGYELTKMIVENAGQWSQLSSTLDVFDAEYSVENNVGPLHPGAERYYEEIGALQE
ncbi:TAXI family TRAP transporter solute-binding subunit [Shouchella shacheensis]|uniref:TAXI family TRAP transporter solute-binding subunit n=1 Tax=Shouchella shacheensis TaxID=1649580 RepID=UPI00074034F6|nr:TAXI family TRAP transporter solute-binding subunit [Shouchella shacheensis]